MLITGGVLLYLGRYVYGGKNFTGWEIWLPGALLVIIAVFYNRRLFSKLKQEIEALGQYKLELNN